MRAMTTLSLISRESPFHVIFTTCIHAIVMSPGFASAGEAPAYTPFVLAKGPKTIDAPPGSSDWTDATTRRAGQLAALRQSPPIDSSVRPEARWQASDLQREPENPPSPPF